ncbi:recombinase family protein [Sutcliffiella horikoshii]|uniref:recombinase family protein n=1 Tax=Sutcliffiella horikoshii TaxID=79883 RepID=UPI003CF61345
MKTKETVNHHHCALMLRISRDKGENEETLQNHREMLQDFAAKQGYTYDTYEEIISGGIQEIDKRPELQRMINNISKYTAILCIALDRLARNGLVSQQIRRLCIDHEIMIITPAQSFDLANSSDDCLLFDISSTFAVREYEMIGKRNKMNKVARAKRGEWISGSVPFGYDRNKETKKLVINEKQAKIVQEIFRLHAAGMGSYKIRDILNAEGLKPAKAKAFNLPSIKRIIKNPVYKGTVVFNDRKRIKKNGKYIYQIVETVVTHEAHPYIIQPDDWEDANKTREERAIKAGMIREKPVIKSEPTILKDLLFCGICGRKMTIRKDNKSDEYFIKICHNLLPDSAEKCMNAGINVKYVIDLFMKEIESYKKEVEIELQKILADDFSSIEEEMKLNIESVENQLSIQRRGYDRILDKEIFADDYDLEHYRKRKQEIRNQISRLEKEREELLMKEQKNIDSSGKEMRYKAIIETMNQLYNHSDRVVQNEYVKTFVKAVYYYRKMPSEIRSLLTRDPRRKAYPFDIVLEYFE